MNLGAKFRLGTLSTRRRKLIVVIAVTGECLNGTAGMPERVEFASRL
jgi:hypothetical protein